MVGNLVIRIRDTRFSYSQKSKEKQEKNPLKTPKPTLARMSQEGVIKMKMERGINSVWGEFSLPQDLQAEANKGWREVVRNKK